MGKGWMLVLVLCGWLSGARVPAEVPAERPPMGWNSWDSYGLSVSEAEWRANVAVLHARLQTFGWTYAVLDEGWYLRKDW